MIFKHNLTNAERKQLRSRLYADLKLTKSLIVKLEARQQELFRCRQISVPDTAGSQATAGTQLQSEGFKSKMPKSKRARKRALQSRKNSHAVKQPRHEYANLRANLMRQCAMIWYSLKSHRHSWIFLQPVDAVKLNLPDYHQIITKPMDLGTIKTKLKNKVYTSPLQFAEDVRLTFANAMKYNPEGQDAHVMASVLLERFESRWRLLSSKLEQGLADCDNHQGEVVGLAAPRNPNPDSRPDRQEVTAVGNPSNPDSRPNCWSGVSAVSYPGNPDSRPDCGSRAHAIRSPGNVDSRSDCGSRIPAIKYPSKSDSRPDLLSCAPMTTKEILDLAQMLEGSGSDEAVSVLKYLKSRNVNVKSADNELNLSFLDSVTMWGVYSLLKQLRKPNEKHTIKEPGDFEDEDVDIGYDIPVSSFPPVVIDRDGSITNSSSSSGTSSGSDSNSSSSSRGPSSANLLKDDSDADSAQIPSSLTETLLRKEPLCDELTINGAKRPFSCIDERTVSPRGDGKGAVQKGGFVEQKCKASPEGHVRAALLKSKFADTILKVQEELLQKRTGVDGETLKEGEELLRKKKARLQAEAKHVAAAVAAKEILHREAEQKAAHLCLQEMETAVELPISVDSYKDLDTGGSFLQPGNPLEQLGLFMKEGDEDML